MIHGPWWGLVLEFTYVWGAGYWTHEARGSELVAVVFWPIAVPVGFFLDKWRWGWSHQRHRYSNMHWYQRGLKERHDTDPNKRWENNA